MEESKIETQKEQGTTQTAKAEDSGNIGQRLPTFAELNNLTERMAKEREALKAENDRMERNIRDQRLAGLSGMSDITPKKSQAEIMAEEISGAFRRR